MTDTTTTSQNFTTLRPYVGQLTSAEWIQETPTNGQHVATLAVDSPTVFDTGTINGSNAGLNSSESGAMFKGRRHQISTPSLPDADTDGFAVAYGSIAPSVPPSSLVRHFALPGSLVRGCRTRSSADSEGNRRLAPQSGGGDRSSRRWNRHTRSLRPAPQFAPD